MQSSSYATTNDRGMSPPLYSVIALDADFYRLGYHTLRDNLPQTLPDKPPFTAHLGNLSYDATEGSVGDFFADCNIVNVRIIEDREQNRPKGFAYAEFGDLEGLKTALTRDGQSFEGRSIRVKVADPRKSFAFTCRICITVLTPFSESRLWWRQRRRRAIPRARLGCS